MSGNGNLTVLLPSGDVLGRHLTTADAAREVLTYDGREFDIVAEGEGGFTLRSRQPVAGFHHWTRTVIYSAADTREAAEAEIFGRVVTAHWERHPDVMADEDYDAMQAEIEAEIAAQGEK